MKRVLTLIFFSIALINLGANEMLGSYFSQYYDALSLKGDVERPYMNYKAYSTNRWEIDDSLVHPWKNKLNEKNPLYEKGNSKLILEDTTLYQSYNHNSPQGMNDGSLWQGKGYNMQLTTGISFFSPHFEASFIPELNFSQNLDFELREAAGWSGSDFGYFEPGIDTPQRFGDEAFWSSALGQTQVRGRLGNWSIGAGTENFWIGPAVDNAIIQSNNAAGYPHIDLGMDKSETKIGFVEFKMWWAILKSSEYYERGEADTYQDFLTGVSASWAPNFLPGLTLGFHKTAQFAFDDSGWYWLVAAIDPGLAGFKNHGSNEDTPWGNQDARASITFSWMFPEVGFEFYGEYAKEDYSNGIQYFLDPGHAAGYVLGVKQIIEDKKHRGNFYMIRAEHATVKWSQDYYINGLGWGAGFYRHSRTNLGYAHGGQTLGAGMGTGGAYQHLGVDYYAPFGLVGCFITRHSLDDTEIYSPGNWDKYTQNNLPVDLNIGVRGFYFLGDGFSIGGELAYVQNFNVNLIKDNNYYGFRTDLTLNYRY